MTKRWFLVFAILWGVACSSGTSGPSDLEPHNVQTGGTCVIDSDCAASAEGVVGCGVDARICQLGARGVEGSTPCLGTKGSTFLSASASPFDRSAMEARGFLCDRVDGLYCDRTARACARQRDLGASCQNDDQCPSTAYCSVDVMRTCVPR